MSTSFELDDVDHLTTGTIGPPGQRVFYLQAAKGDQLVSLRLEKTLVAALVRYLGALLADLPPAGPLPTDLGLREPVVAEWVVGGLGASYDEQADRVVLLAEELVGEEQVGEELLGEDEREGAVARFRATREQVAAFAMHGAGVVEAGRPPCPLCGQPLDAEGHVCARLNGHRPQTT
ncbi:MAG: DUF3090 domain-containing protein [Actinobacteria bacterium]|nr:MAG: DUF3090 domain-containing protein [Actinomycetota bacterium]